MEQRARKGYVLPGQMNILYSGEQVAATLEKNAVVTQLPWRPSTDISRKKCMWILLPANIALITTALNPGQEI